MTDYAELIKKLSAELDEQTRRYVLPPTTRPLVLIGSRQSVFLKAVVKKACELGLETEFSHMPAPYQPAIIDRETAKDIHLTDWQDIDRSYHEGMSAVSQAVLTLLLAADLVEGKNITIVGRGHAVQGLAQSLIGNHATVTVAHSKTPSLLCATAGRDIVIYATPTLTRPVMSNTYDLVIDLGNAYPHPERLSCPYVSKIGQLTTSILLNRYMQKKGEIF